jgi:hypothetical protein
MSIKSFFAGIVTDAENLFSGVFNTGTLKASASAELASVEQSAVAFVKTDIGSLALDAVNMAEGKVAGTSGDDKFAAAKAQFIADAKTAGHDLETLGKGVVDWMIQTAYTYAVNVAVALAAKAATVAITATV